jgi:hypothetical protein
MSVKTAIAYSEGIAPQQPRAFWPTIGSAWKSAKVPGAISIEIGRKTKVNGELKSVFANVNLEEGSRLFLQPNKNKKDGTKAPDFYVALVQDDETESK